MRIEITSAAEKFVRRMIRFGNVSGGGGFRLAVSPRGGSGLAPEFEVVGEPRAGDAVLERNGLKLFLPVESRQLLEGVTIDCAGTSTASGFIFHDPKTSGSTCGTDWGPSPQLVNLGTQAGVRG